jgi:hypothetical protein
MKELVQQQRAGLYETGNQTLCMAVPVPMIVQIDILKKRYGLRSRDAIIARIIRKSLTTIRPDSFVQRSAASPDIAYRWITPIVAIELVDYMKEIQKRFRSLSLGGAFEMIFAEVGEDLSNPAIQLELIEARR